MFFGLIGKTRWPPWPLIAWNIFDFSFETAERNSMKLDRKQDPNVLYQMCVFRTDRKNKMAALAYPSKSGTLYSGARYVALWASCFRMFSLSCYVMLLRMWRCLSFHGINAMILMLQIFDVTANENACYNRNELEYFSNVYKTNLTKRIRVCVLRCLRWKLISIGLLTLDILTLKKKKIFKIFWDKTNGKLVVWKKTD